MALGSVTISRTFIRPPHFEQTVTSTAKTRGRVEADARLREPQAFIAAWVGVVASAPPTDPDVRISRIRLLKSELR